MGYAQSLGTEIVRLAKIVFLYITLINSKDKNVYIAYNKNKENTENSLQFLFNFCKSKLAVGNL